MCKLPGLFKSRWTKVPGDSQLCLPGFRLLNPPFERASTLLHISNPDLVSTAFPFDHQPYLTLIPPCCSQSFVRPMRMVANTMPSDRKYCSSEASPLWMTLQVSLMLVQRTSLYNRSIELPGEYCQRHLHLILNRLMDWQSLAETHASFNL